MVPILGRRSGLRRISRLPRIGWTTFSSDIEKRWMPFRDPLAS